MAKKTPPSSSPPAKAPTTPVDKGTKRKAAPAKAAPATPKASAPRKPRATAKAPPAKTAFQAWAAGGQASMDELVDHCVEGGHLAGFCKVRGFSYATVLRWIRADAERVKLYASAREDRGDVLAEEIQAISDEIEVEAQYQGENVTLGISASAVARNRLRVDARKWLAAKMKPRVYGDKLEHTGSVELTFEQRLLALNAAPVPEHAELPRDG
jgi:hypothetical protein